MNDRNRDIVQQYIEQIQDLLTNLKYLEDSSIEMDFSEPVDSELLNKVGRARNKLYEIQGMIKEEVNNLEYYLFGEHIND